MANKAKLKGSRVSRCIQALMSPGREIRGQAARELASLARRVNITQAIAALTERAAGPEMDVWTLDALQAALEQGGDLSGAVSVLERLALLSATGLRQRAAKTLALIEEKASPLTARRDIPLPGFWSLEEVHRRPILGIPGAPPIPGPDELPCGVCGGPNTDLTFERDYGGADITSYVKDIRHEVHCQDCGGYSIYHWYDVGYPCD